MFRELGFDILTVALTILSLWIFSWVHKNYAPEISVTDFAAISALIFGIRNLFERS
jgi:hypothetical protein